MKTPVASLLIGLHEGNDPDGALRKLALRIDHRIRHHLGAARRVMSSAGISPKTDVSRVVADLCGALSLIHAERRLEFCASIAEGLSVSCDERDVEEMFGNLMDNAFKWASSRVVVTAERDGPSVRIAVVDDGPGIPIDRLQAVMLPGIREDERVPGDGFGLAIVTEVASLYGGSLSLKANSSIGLSAILVLPAL